MGNVKLDLFWGILKGCFGLMLNILELIFIKESSTCYRISNSYSLPEVLTFCGSEKFLTSNQSPFTFAMDKNYSFEDWTLLVCLFLSFFFF